MPIGDRPILDIVLRQLAASGFEEVTLAVGHLAELIMAYCGDGSKFGVRLAYSREEQPLGTAGPIRLAERASETFLVMNGDLLTSLSFSSMLAAHRSTGRVATVASFRRDVTIDFGVLEADDAHLVTNYLEKPTFSYSVSTGIYLMEPAVVDFIPEQARFDLPDLVLRLIANGHAVGEFPFSGHWLDIGRHDDYEAATRIFESARSAFLPSPLPPA
jgi:NDP-sugar pyrophosphorylase family protein